MSQSLSMVKENPEGSSVQVVGKSPTPFLYFAQLVVGKSATCLVASALRPTRPSQKLRFFERWGVCSILPAASFSGLR